MCVHFDYGKKNYTYTSFAKLKCMNVLCFRFPLETQLTNITMMHAYSVKISYMQNSHLSLSTVSMQTKYFRLTVSTWKKFYNTDQHALARVTEETNEAESLRIGLNITDRNVRSIKDHRRVKYET